MGKYYGRVYHPHAKGAEKNVFKGFSWPCLVSGVFWFAVKEMWGWFLISTVLTFITLGISWFVFPFFANQLYAKDLMDKGYQYL
jgi:hypothetical protein